MPKMSRGGVKNLSVPLIAVIAAVVLGGLLVGCLFAADLLLGTEILTGRISPVREGLYLETAKSRVHIGDKREDALEAMSDAWFHAECSNPNSTVVTEDLFFYGSHNPDEVAIIHVMYKKNGNDESIINFVGQVENYTLHLYEHCKPLPYEAFDNMPTSEQ